MGMRKFRIAIIALAMSVMPFQARSDYFAIGVLILDVCIHMSGENVCSKAFANYDFDHPAVARAKDRLVWMATKCQYDNPGLSRLQCFQRSHRAITGK